MNKDIYEGWGWVVKDYGELLAMPDLMLPKVKGVKKELTLTKDSKFFSKVLGLLNKHSGLGLSYVSQIERVSGVYMRVKIDVNWSEWVYGADAEDALDELSSRYDLFSEFF